MSGYHLRMAAAENWLEHTLDAHDEVQLAVQLLGRIDFYRTDRRMAWDKLVEAQGVLEMAQKDLQLAMGLQERTAGKAGEAGAEFAKGSMVTDERCEHRDLCHELSADGEVVCANMKCNWRSKPLATPYVSD